MYNFIYSKNTNLEKKCSTVVLEIISRMTSVTERIRTVTHTMPHARYKVYEYRPQTDTRDVKIRWTIGALNFATI